MYTEKKLPKIVLSFDDGRKDNYRIAINILEPRKLGATFNITTGYIDGSLSDRNCITPNPAMSIQEIKRLYQNNLFEIAGHGDSHLNTRSDWMAGVEKLKLWLGNEWYANGIGIASPHSAITYADELCNKENWKNTEVKYIRLGLTNQKEFTQKIFSKSLRIIKSPLLFSLLFNSSCKKIGNDFFVYSVPILNHHSFDQIYYLIKKTIAMKKDCILMFHSILKKGEANENSMWSWDYDKFEKLCDKITELREQNQIAVISTIEALKNKDR